jgi:hypothetical protein
LYLSTFRLGSADEASAAAGAKTIESLIFRDAREV